MGEFARMNNLTTERLIQGMRNYRDYILSPNDENRDFFTEYANALESADATLEKAREIVRKAKRTIDEMGSWDQSEWEWEQLAELLGMEDE